MLLQEARAAIEERRDARVAALLRRRGAPQSPAVAAPTEVHDEEPERVEKPAAPRSRSRPAAAPAPAAAAQPSPARRATKTTTPAVAPPATSAGLGYIIPTVIILLLALAVILYFALFSGESSALVVV